MKTGLKDNSFLQRGHKALNVLTDKQLKGLIAAAANNIPILIAGKHRPTGKSTLCNFLRDNGVDAVEEWELKEEEQWERLETENANTTYFLITLNKEIDIKRISEE